MLQPFEIATFDISAPSVPTFRINRVGDAEGSACQSDYLFAEPDKAAGEWLGTCLGRMAVISGGPHFNFDGMPELHRERINAVVSKWDSVQDRVAKLRAIGHGFGSPCPKIVFVGEQDPSGEWPFVGKWSAFFFQALREMGHDEMSLYLCNAMDRDGNLVKGKLLEIYELFAEFNPVWVALGSNAVDTLQHCGIRHLGARHPAWIRRKHSRAGPDAYAQILKEASVPLGCWRGKLTPNQPDLPIETDQDAATRFVKLFDLPAGAFRLKEDEPVKEPDNKPKGISTNTTKVHQAQTLYVTGAVTDLKEACTAVGILTPEQQTAVRWKAKEEDWDQERNDHLKTVREKTKSTSAEAEAKAIVQARQLGWTATVLGLANLVKDMKQGTKVYAKDVKSLVDATLALSALSDMTAEGERGRLAALSPTQLLDEMKKTVDGMFGESEPVKKEIGP